MASLSGLLVLDFTTLLPGPLATLMLAEAGAEVIKIERPGGEEMRSVPPHWHGISAPFALLNRGKQSLGLGHAAVSALNPRIVYCSITGYGQDGPRAHEAGHDLNYIGNTGLLALQP